MSRIKKLRIKQTDGSWTELPIDPYDLATEISDGLMSSQDKRDVINIDKTNLNGLEIDPNEADRHLIYTIHENTPDGGIKSGWIIRTYFHNEDDKTLKFQLAQDDRYGSLAIRQYSSENNTWSEWREFSYSGHTHSNYLPLSGGTMTGNLITKDVFPSTNGGAGLGTKTNGYNILRLYGGCRGEITMYYGSHMALLAPTAVRALGINSGSPIPFEGAAYGNISSRRYKDNIQSMSEEEANKILDIDIVTFDYKEKYGTKNQRGCIAEQVVEHIPSVILDGYDIDGQYYEINSIDYSKFVPYLIKKVQMLDEKVKELSKS